VNSRRASFILQNHRSTAAGTPELYLALVFDFSDADDMIGATLGALGGAAIRAHVDFSMSEECATICRSTFNQLLTVVTSHVTTG
jgi:hypothetical protein